MPSLIWIALIAGASPEEVPYDCSFVRVEASRCAPSPKWIAELDHLGAIFIGNGGEPEEEICRGLNMALAEALSAELSTLTAIERVVAQNGALRAFGPRSCEAWTPGMSVKAARAVMRLALPAKAIEELGSEPWADVDAMIGKRATWVERQTKHEGLFHDTAEFFTQAFRPVRSGSIRAVMSQLVAIDDAGRTHVTPAIGRVEMREGMALDGRACVAKLDASRLRCRSGRVRPLAEEQLPNNQFVQRIAPGKVGCNQCHGVPDADANLVDLTDQRVLSARRIGFLQEAQLAADAVRRKAE